MFRRRLLRLKRRRRRLIYRFKPKEDGRNKTAQTLDLVVVVFIFWLVTLVLLTQFFKISLALSVSLFLAAAGGAAANYFQKRQKQLRRQHYRLWLTGQRYRAEIKKIKTREELAVYVALLLAQLPHFTDLQVSPKGAQKGPLPDEAVALSARYKGVPVAVQCIPPVASGREETKLWRGFQQALEEQGFVSVLIVAPGGLAPEARRIITRLKNQYRVVVLNEEKLVELALHARQQPEAEDIQEGTAGQKEIEERKLVFARRKGLNYLLTAGVLYFIYFLSRPAGLTSVLYLVLIAINVALAFMCYVFNSKEEDDLEDLEPEK